MGSVEKNVKLGQGNVHMGFMVHQVEYAFTTINKYPWATGAALNITYNSLQQVPMPSQSFDELNNGFIRLKSCLDMMNMQQNKSSYGPIIAAIEALLSSWNNIQGQLNNNPNERARLLETLKQEVDRRKA